MSALTLGDDMYLMTLIITVLFSLIAPLVAQQENVNSSAPPQAAPRSNHSPNPPTDTLPEEFKDYQEESTLMPALMNMLLMLGLLVLLIFLASWILRKVVNTRIQQVNDTSDIKVVERRSLTAKTAIYLLQIRDKEIAVAESSNGISLLSIFQPNEESSSPSSFDRVLQQKKDAK
jgi:flagellar biogenesis protein FliO